MRRLMLVLSLLFVFVPALALAAQPARTGQTTCYDAAGASIACTGTGQDGAHLKGVVWPAPRFTDNNNGTVTDNLTSLIWLKDANCTDTFGSVSRTNGYLTWANALTWVNSLADGASNDCGLSDSSTAGQWRLPNITELESLISLEDSAPALPTGYPFSNLLSGNYWSATTYWVNTGFAWTASLSSGMVSYGAKTSSYYVLAVRGNVTTATPAPLSKTGQTVSYANGDDGALQKGALWPTTRFTAASGAVTDNHTGLIWLQNVNCSGAFGLQTWSSALTSANTLASGSCGLTDGSTAGQWRLPNRRELASLIDRGANGPALPSGHPFTGVQNNSPYWLSSSYDATPANAWTINIGTGYQNGIVKTGSSYIWPVRDGVTTSYTLTVNTSGIGTGTVTGTSTPPGTPGITNCSGTCSSSYNSGITVNLTATPTGGSTFAGWGGDCTGTGTCNLVMSANGKSVTATFNPATLTCAPPSGPHPLPSANNGGSYTVSWGASATPSVTYLLEEATNSGFTVGLRTVTSGSSATSAAITGRTAGNTYYYRVKAQRGGYADSAWSATVSIPVTNVCVAPTGLNAPSNNTTGSYTVGWKASPTSAVTYVLQEATDSGFTANLRTAYTGPATSAAITGRSTGVTYYYRVQATHGTYTPSTYAGPVSTAVAFACGTPRSLFAPAAATINSSYRVNWSASSTPGVTYVLEEATSSSFASPTTVYTGTALSTSLSKSTATTYYYRVRATLSGYANSAWKGPARTTVTGAVLAPASIYVPATNTTGSYRVSWSISRTAGGVTYQLQEKVGAGSWADVTLPDPSLNYYNVTGKANGSYSYQVKAKKTGVTDSAYVGPKSTTVTLTCAPPGAITAPASNTTGSYTVSWRASSTPGVSYTLQEATDSSFTTPSTPYTGAATSAAITGKTDGSYYYRVKATRSGYVDSAWRQAGSPVLVDVP